MMTRETYRDLKLYEKIRHLYRVPEEETLPREMAALLDRLDRRDNSEDRRRA
jgi:hypothetical protein